MTDDVAAIQQMIDKWWTGSPNNLAGSKEEFQKGIKALMHKKVEIRNRQYVKSPDILDNLRLEKIGNNMTASMTATEINDKLDATIKNQHLFSLCVDWAMLFFICVQSVSVGAEVTEATDIATTQPAVNLVKATFAASVATVPGIVIFDDSGTFTKFISQFFFASSRKIETRIDNFLDAPAINRGARISRKAILVIVAIIIGLAVGIGTQKFREERLSKKKRDLLSEGYTPIDNIDVKIGSLDAYTQFQKCGISNASIANGCELTD